MVEPEKLLAESKRQLGTILSMAPLAIRGVMEAIHSGYDMPLAEALHLEAVHFAKVCASQDKAEGVSAFLSKREAKFSGE